MNTFHVFLATVAGITASYFVERYIGIDEVVRVILKTMYYITHES